jgi:glutaconate CoA-transferase subunit A
MQDKRMNLREAVNRYVTDGCSIAFGGVVSREPYAACMEIIRQKKRNLTFISDSQSDAVEALIAAGCIKRIEAAYIWIGVIGMAYNLRRAVENSVPNHIEFMEYSNLGMSARFMAGASGLPFMPTKSMLGSDIIKNNPDIKVVNDPYGTGPIALVPAAQPDVAFIHVQRADQNGNAQIWGMLMNDDLIARAAKNVILTCEEIIPTRDIRKIPNMTAIPSYHVSAVVEVPFGAHPCSVAGYYWLDMPFRRQIMDASRTRDGIVRWLDEWVYGTENHQDYIKKVGIDRLLKLKDLEHDHNCIPNIG